MRRPLLAMMRCEKNSNGTSQQRDTEHFARPTCQQLVGVTSTPAAPPVPCGPPGLQVAAYRGLQSPSGLYHTSLVFLPQMAPYDAAGWPDSWANRGGGSPADYGSKCSSRGRYPKRAAHIKAV